MALDEPKEDDKVFKEDGITFLVNKALLEEAKTISVDFIATPVGGGFKITSGLASAGGCGSSCSC
jgi:Fe-S cluster assembly iron-binding protein IscA